MLKTVRDACTPHPGVFKDDPLDDIDDLVKVRADLDEAREFFARSHTTAGMCQLFEQGLRRLAGTSDQAVFELTQAMGGGKTHSLVAFGLLAQHPTLRASVVPEISASAPFETARVVTFTGRRYPDHYFWGDIAEQLGRPELFRRFWSEVAGAPDADDWVELIGDKPTLILLDELPPWFEYAVTRRVGDGNLAQVATAALSNLLVAALRLPRLCIVLSNLSGTFQDAAKELRRAIKNAAAEARRQAKPITPVDLGGDEIYQILKKRLFDRLPSDDDIETVTQAYVDAITEAEKSKAVAKTETQWADEIRRAYPFHPVIKDIIALFRNNESFRQTRGLKDFVSKMIRSVWDRDENDVHLIGLQHLDLNRVDVREEIVRINDLRNAIAKDIAASGEAHAEVIDAELDSDSGSQVATLLLAASLSRAVDAVKGLTKQRLLECLVAPYRPAHEFADAFEHLRREAWYLHKDASEAFYFSNVENLVKRLATEAERAPEPRVTREMRRRLTRIFAPQRRNAYQELQALPEIESVRLGGARVLLILSPDTRNPPEEAKRFHESVVEKNNLCILTGDGSDLSSLTEVASMIFAIAKVRAELPESAPQQIELAEKDEQAALEFYATVKATFNRVWYPHRRGLVSTSLDMQFDGNHFDGEEQVERALASIGVSKLVLDWETDPAGLITRAEDMLWPEGRKRAPWRDIKQAAIETVRWPWLPASGIDRLRKVAEERGAWRSTGDGYIERGPFEKEKTSVGLVERHYDDATGEATLEVTPKHAGKSGQVFYGSTSSVSSASTRLDDSKLRTTETHLWFLAVDPTGEHTTGEPVAWTNGLTITHQPSDGPEGRTVRLQVVPTGTIKYTLDGSNPREGTTYAEPIPIGDEATTVYCFAEERGIEATRQFTVPAAGRGGVEVDPDRPARLKQVVSTDDTADSYALLERLRQMSGELGQLAATVGSGAESATTRFGSGTSVQAANVESVLTALRGSLGQAEADVRLRTQWIAFATGRDLIAFARERGITLSVNDVEQ